MYNTNIRLLRKASKMTQDDLANLLNVKRHTICDWESGRTEPNLCNIKKLAEIFKISADFIIGFNNSNSEYHYKVLSKFKVENELEYQLLADVSKLNQYQQTKLLNIIKELKEFNKA